MVNVITGNPLILDTAADNLFAPGVTLHITNMFWNLATAVGNTLQVENGSEVVIWKVDHSNIGTADNVLVPTSQITFRPPLRVSGLSLGTIDAGILYIYLAKGSL